MGPARGDSNDSITTVSRQYRSYGTISYQLEHRGSHTDTLCKQCKGRVGGYAARPDPKRDKLLLHLRLVCVWK